MQVDFDPKTGWVASFNIPYRGDRDYLNGADLYAAASQLVAHAASRREIRQLDVRYPRFTRNAGCFRLSSQEDLGPDFRRSSVRIRADLEDGTTLVGWYDEGSEAARDRFENHEKIVVASTDVREQFASYLGDTRPPLIEVVVYTTKTLLQTVFREACGKWIFTGIKSRPLHEGDRSGLQVSIDAELSSRAVVCSLTNSSEYVGDIYFGLLAK